MDKLKLDINRLNENSGQYSEWIISDDILGNPVNLEIGFYKYSRVIAMFAENKNLDKLDIPEGLTSLYCCGNFLKELNLPSSLDRLHCDKEAFDYDKCKVETVKIYYETRDKL
jgi:hypothetical protein